MPGKAYLSGSVSLSTHVKGNPRKHPVWVLRYRLPSGKQSDKTLGKAWIDTELWARKQEVKYLRSRPKDGFLTRDQAEALKQNFLDEHAEVVPDDRKSFGRAIEEFLAEKTARGTRGSTLHEYRRIAERLCARPWGSQTWRERPLDSFTEEDLTGLRDEMKAAGNGAHTINQTRGVVRGAFGDRRVIQAWKWTAVRKVESRGKIRFYTPEQVALLKDHALTDDDRLIYTLKSEAGLRISEVRGLKISQLDFEHRLIRMEDGYTTHGGHAGTKGHKVRAVPMSDNLSSGLKAHIAQRPPYDANGEPTLVFEYGPGIPLDYDQFNRRFIKAIKAARLHKITPHELRHTFGTQMIRIVDIYTLQRLMGHEHITTTEIYLHFRPDPELGSKMSGLWHSDEGAEVVPLRQVS